MILAKSLSNSKKVNKITKTGVLSNLHSICLPQKHMPQNIFFTALDVAAWALIFFYLGVVGPDVNSGPLSTWPPGAPELGGHFLYASRAGKMHIFWGHSVLVKSQGPH